MPIIHHQSSVSEPKCNLFESLPKEILDIILDDLHDDTATLKACSTVCQTLLPVSQAHIFRNVTLEYFDYSTNTEPSSSHHFLDTISTSPHLAYLVQELKFTKGYTPRRPSATVPESIQSTSEDKRMAHEVVAQILVALPRMRTLKLRAFGMYLLWSVLPATVTTALFQVVQLPTLRQLDLGVIWQTPVSFLRSRLTRLHVLRFGELKIPFVSRIETTPTTDVLESRDAL